MAITAVVTLNPAGPIPVAAPCQALITISNSSLSEVSFSQIIPQITASSEAGYESAMPVAAGSLPVPLPIVPAASAAIAAHFTGTITGTATPVTLTAVTAGTAGNSISLTGDGTSTISQLITAWNIAHPSNTVALTSGDGSQIPDLAAVASLSGGVNLGPGSTNVTYPITFNGGAGGIYSVGAIIYDTSGGVTAATPATITVVGNNQYA